MNDTAGKTSPPAETIREIRAAVAARKLPTAIALARQALDAGFEHAQLLHLRSTWLEQQGRPLEALVDLERAHQLDPADIAVLMALGFLLAQLQRPLLARKAFERAAELRPDLPGPRLQVGWVCENTGQVDAARKAYDTVLDIEPGHAYALGRQAMIAAQQGEWANAAALAERALASDPKEFTAALAMARADMNQGRLDEAERRLVELAARRLTPEDVHLVQHEIGSLRHRQGRFPDAFAAWSAGNDAAYRRHAPLFGGQAGAPPMMRALIRHFSAEPAWSPVHEPAGSGPDVHVFLMGFARSGTTLLEQVLAAHPDVVAMDEKDVLAAAVEQLWSSPEGLSRLRGATSEMLSPYRELYWRDAAEYGFRPERRVFIDKSPFNALRLPLIARLFPKAKILFALRDPRDVVFSCFRTHFRTNFLTFEFLKVERAAKFYADYMELAHLYLEKTLVDVMTVRHEALVDDFKGGVAGVCEFIDIDLQPHMLGFESAKRTVATPSAHQLRAGLNRSGIGQWRSYAEQLAPAQAHLKPWVERLGYAE